MKKSEALKKLKPLLKNWEGSDLTYRNQFGKELFKFLEEEIGMMPPPKKGVVEVIYNEDDTMTIPIWKWENEK